MCIRDSLRSVHGAVSTRPFTAARRRSTDYRVAASRHRRRHSGQRQQRRRRRHAGSSRVQSVRGEDARRATDSAAGGRRVVDVAAGRRHCVRGAPGRARRCPRPDAARRRRVTARHPARLPAGRAARRRRRRRVVAHLLLSLRGAALCRSDVALLAERAGGRRSGRREVALRFRVPLRVRDDRRAAGRRQRDAAVRAAAGRLRRRSDVLDARTRSADPAHDDAVRRVRRQLRALRGGGVQTPAVGVQSTGVCRRAADAGRDD